MKTLRNFFIVLLFSGYYISCKQGTEMGEAPTATEIQVSDPLPSWNKGATKEAIVNFVEKVTNPDSAEFVAVEDRIATFDNDGNLWSEQPLYFQLIFAMERIKAMAEDHPEWKTTQPYKAVIEDDKEALIASGKKGLLQLVMASHTGMTTEEFNATSAAWLETSKHPRFNEPYHHMVYQPMLELLAYLRANDFKTFIVSGGGIDFLRVWAPEAYGIPTDQIVGSSVKATFEYKDGDAVIRKIPEINFVDDHEGKPIGIHQHIGKRPIFASGNSDGDLEMLQYTDSNELPSFMLYLHHTDAEREWAYDRESHIGKLDKGLDEAHAKGWTVIDMKKDWKVIYPFQKMDTETKNQ
ncbi:MAG: HAD family hydrolase [Flavobacteriaceae bacterium]